MAFGDDADVQQTTRILQATKANGISVTVEPDRSYTLIHLGKDVLGADFYYPIWFTFQQDFGDSGAPSADYSAEANKLVLLDGHRATLPPGITKIAYRISTTPLTNTALFAITSSAPQWGAF